MFRQGDVPRLKQVCLIVVIDGATVTRVVVAGTGRYPVCCRHPDSGQRHQPCPQHSERDNAEGEILKSLFSSSSLSHTHAQVSSYKKAIKYKRDSSIVVKLSKEIYLRRMNPRNLLDAPPFFQQVTLQASDPQNR